MTSIATLIRLSKNPNYKLSPEQLKQLEEYRAQQNKPSQDNVKHSTDVLKHPTEFTQEEKRKGRG